MKFTFKSTVAVGLLASAGLLMSASAFADPVLCQDAAKNHMIIDDATVSECLGAGMGNLTGNPANDLFLTSAAGADYVSAGKSDGDNPFNLSYTQSNGTGTFSFDSSIWDTSAHVAIGFKFGTGNQPDEWFVFALQDLVSGGSWEFVNVFGTGGGLSHMNLYRIEGTREVPEPGSLALLGLGLVGLGLARRRRAAS